MIIIHDILQAKRDIQDVIERTPIVHSESLSKITKNEIYIKAEYMQKAGSYKIRGVANKMRKMLKEKASYFTTASNGKHGLAVAFLAKKFDVPVTVVVPEDIQQDKVKSIENFGGKIERFGNTIEQGILRAKELAKEGNGVFIPPSNDAFIMTGQGTIGLEILAQHPKVNVIIVPIGGGGLVAGILTAVKQSKPNVKVIGVEPENSNATYLSIKDGEITEISNQETIAEELEVTKPGFMTFPIIQNNIDDIVLVSEEEIKQAQLLAEEHLEQQIDPSSAVSIAAIVSGKLDMVDKHIVCVL